MQETNRAVGDDAGIVDYLAQVYALNKQWKKE